MIKLTFCLRRLPQLSLAEFQRYWLENHGPLVRRHAGALKIKRYVQLHTLDHAANEVLRASREAGEPYDGVAELWFDDWSALEKALASKEAAAAVEDERKFIDHSRVAFFISEEHHVI